MSWGLVSLFFLLRPLMFIKTDMSFFGLGFFDIISILMIGLLLVALALNIITKKTKVNIGPLLIVLVFYIFWSSVLIFHEVSTVKGIANYVLPVLTFLVCVSVIKNEKDCYFLLKMLIVGFIIPITYSSILIYRGATIGQEIYWTGVVRYQGVYSGFHTMAHNMFFFLMIVVLYFAFSKEYNIKRSFVFSCLCLVESFLAIYCLNKSVVRTVFVGLSVFIVVYTYKTSKLMFALMLLVAVVVMAVKIETIKVVFFDVDDAVKGKTSMDMAGSGRPYFWKHNIQKLNDSGIGWLVGLGTASRGFHRDKLPDMTKPFNSHNDFLDIVVSQGLIGFLLYFLSHVYIFFRILKLPIRLKNVYLGLFIASVFVNFLSNSFIARFGVSQLYWMLISFVYVVTSLNVKSDTDSSTR